MEPINKKERKMSILSFLGVFLLTILPICLGVYLYAKVDSTENRHLRELVRTQQSSAEESEDVSNIETNLSNQILGLKKFLESQKEVSAPNISSEIVNKVSDISSTSASLSDQLRGQDRKEYLSMIIEMKNSLNNFNEIYKKIHGELDDAYEEIDEKVELLEDQNRLLKENGLN